MGFAAAAAALAVGASVAGGVMSSDAQNQATEQNAANVTATNQMNWNMFQQSRGSKGSAVMPLYLKGPNGQPFEDTMGQNAIGLYNAAGGNLSPAQQIAMYQALATQFQPMLNQANSTAQGIFNGGVVNQELANYAPVAAATQANVTGQKEANMESLQQTLNQIKSIQAGQGFSGDSFGTNLMSENAIRSANTGNAALQGAANLQTAQAQSGIRQGGLNLQLQNLNLPSTMLAQNTAFANAPQNAAMAQEGQRQQLFNMFRIGTGQFQYQNLPTRAPMQNAMTSVAGGGAALGGALGNLSAAQGGGNPFGSSGWSSGSGWSGSPGGSWDSNPNLDPFGSQYTPTSTAGVGVNPESIGASSAFYDESGGGAGLLD